MAYWGQTTMFCSSAGWTAVTAWAATTAKTVGQIVRQTSPSVTSERCFICITAGTTGGSEPSWTLTRGATTTDGTVTWMECTGVAAYNGDQGDNSAWLAVKNQSVSLGTVIKDSGGTHVFMCTTAGSTGNGAEPTWDTSAVGNTTADSSATWKYMGLGSSFSKFGAPHARMETMTNNSGWGSNGSTTDVANFYVADNHAETQSSGGISWSAIGTQTSPVQVLCIDHVGTLPPTSADLKTTATCTTTSGTNVSINGYFKELYGITFNCSTAFGTTLSLAADAFKDKVYNHCGLNNLSTSAATLAPTSGSNAGRTIVRNSTIKFASTGTNISAGGVSIWENCTFDGSGSIPTDLVTGSNGMDITFKGCDLSALTGNLFKNNGSMNYKVQFIDCKLNASYSPRNSFSSTGYGEYLLISRCGSAGRNNDFYFSTISGTTQTNLTVYRDTGATDNAVPYSFKSVTQAWCKMGAQEFTQQPLAAYNATVSANVTATVYGMINAATAPTNFDIALQVEYLGSATDPQATIARTRTDVLATPTAFTIDTASDWGQGLTARQNSHAYSVGDIIGVSSNTKIPMFCTTAGTSAGSLPGGYASVTDGNTVTDGTAVFRAAVRFSMALTLSSPQPKIAGAIYGTVILGMPSQSNIFIDPVLVLT